MKKDIGHYIVYSNGSVWSTKRNCYLKASPSNTGYLRVKMFSKKQSLHRLMALTFIPNTDNKPEVNHKDGNKLNNDVSNLEWATRLENERHSRNVLGKVTASGWKQSDATKLKLKLHWASKKSNSIL